MIYLCPGIMQLISWCEPRQDHVWWQLVGTRFMYLLKLRTDELTVVENHYPENLYPVFGQWCASGSARIHTMIVFMYWERLMRIQEPDLLFNVSGSTSPMIMKNDPLSPSCRWLLFPRPPPWWSRRWRSRPGTGRRWRTSSTAATSPWMISSVPPASCAPDPWPSK